MKKILLTIFILIQITGCVEQHSNTNLTKEKSKQCKCMLFEKNDLMVNFSNFNRSDAHLISVYLASDKDYWTSFNCVDDLDGNDKVYYCIGDDDAGRLWLKINEKEFNVKFGNIRLDTEYRDENDEINSKYIVSTDTGYIQGKYICCE